MVKARVDFVGLTKLLTWAAFPLLLSAPQAWADIYKWTDERGVTVLSSSPPEDVRQARNVEVVAKEPRRAARSAAAAAEEQAAATEQRLLDRIENLERQLRAQQYARETPVAPAPPQAIYTTPPPAPYYADSYYRPPYAGYYPYAPYPYLYPAVSTVVIHSRRAFPHSHSSRAFGHKRFPRPLIGSSGFSLRSMHHGRR